MLPEKFPIRFFYNVNVHYRWTHVVVDRVEAKLGNHSTVKVDVIFITTDDGKLRKLVRLPGHNKTCMIEEIKIVPNGDHKPVKAIKLASDMVGTRIGFRQKMTFI